MSDRLPTGREMEQQALRNALPLIPRLTEERDRARDLAAHLESELAETTADLDAVCAQLAATLRREMGR